MSDAGFRAAISIVPRPSRRLRRALIVFHASLAALAFYALPDTLAGFCMALASGVHCAQWLHELAHAGDGVQAVLLDSTGVWWIQHPDGRRERARLAARSLVLPTILVLPLHRESDRRPLRLILLADNLPADDLRRLRVRLLWQSRAAPS